MKNYISVLFIFFAFCSMAQTNLDSMKIDALVRGTIPLKETLSDDIRIIKAIQAIDKNFDSIILSTTNYTPKKFTVIESNNICVRQLLNKSKAIQIILNDTMGKINYKIFWDKADKDTIEFLSGIVIRSKFDLNYPNYQYPQAFRIVNPFTIKLNTQNILFYSKQIDKNIDSLSKSLNKKQLRPFYKYLSTNIDHFCLKKKIVEQKAIRILTITFGNDNMVYTGMDIYGTHYLLTFDSSNSWHLESIKALWTY